MKTNPTRQTESAIRSMVNLAVDKQRGAPVGAYLTTNYLSQTKEFEFVMVGPNGTTNRLLASETTQERLDAHWQGFVANYELPTVAEQGSGKFLRFNGKLFAPLGTNDTDDCHGYFRMNSARGVHLYKLTGQLEAYIVSNVAQGHFVVSASIRNGQPWYMNSTCSLTEKWLGIEDMGMADQHEAVRTMKFEPMTKGVH